jgi:hypothetical protein
MNAQTIISLISVIVSVAVAVTVPLFAYRLALRQEHARWLRDRRAELYIDLLTEAYAEQQWLQMSSADGEARERFSSHFPDLRLPPADRARLGTRGTMFGSSTTNKLFNLLAAEALWGTIKPRTGGPDTVLRVRVGRIMEELQRVVREEMRSVNPAQDFHSALLDEPHPAERETRNQMAEMERRMAEMGKRMTDDPDFRRSAGLDPDDGSSAHE